MVVQEIMSLGGVSRDRLTSTSEAGKSTGRTVPEAASRNLRKYGAVQPHPAMQSEERVGR
jgi:hypothetical protein